MKKRLELKAILFCGWLVFLFGGCSQQSEADVSQKLEKVRLEQEKVLAERKSRLTSLLSEVAKSNLLAIEVSKIADGKSANRDVVKLSKSLIRYHTEYMELLEEFAEENDIEIPTKITDAELAKYQKLQKKPNLRFDLEYCRLMVLQHEQMIEKLEKEHATNDVALSKFIDASMPELRTYYDGSLYTQRQVKAIAEMQ